MAHHTVKQGYLDLAERINRFPQGAPPSELLFQILEMLFSEREAELVSLLPIRPFTADRAARAWKMPVAAARVVLDELAGRAILLDIESEDGTTYALPPPMAGFFEFSMMRIARRHRSAPSRRAASSVPQRRRGLRPGAVRRAARPSSAGPSSRSGALAAGARRCRSSTTSAPAMWSRAPRQSHRHQPLLLPTQDGAPGSRLFDAPKDICMTFNGATAQSLIRSRLRPPRRRRRVPGPLRRGTRIGASCSSARTSSAG